MKKYNLMLAMEIVGIVSSVTLMILHRNSPMIVLDILSALLFFIAFFLNVSDRIK